MPLDYQMPQILIPKEAIADPIKDKRVKVLRDTISQFQLSGDYYQACAASNLYTWSKTPKAIPHENKISVINDDWGVVAQNMTKNTGEIFAVLNMANAVHPGGGYLQGAAAQEENIFRRSDSHFSIKQEDLHDSKYKFHMQNLINAKHGMVYLDKRNPRVCIKAPERNCNGDGYELLPTDEIFLFYELRSAAEDLGSKGKHFCEREARQRIKAQLATLMKNNVRNVVLSAFGCGAFKNPPEQIAEIYRQEIIKVAEHFDNITFAIYNPTIREGLDPNYLVFKNKLDQLQIGPASTTLGLAVQPQLTMFSSASAVSSNQVMIDDNMLAEIYTQASYKDPNRLLKSGHGQKKLITALEILKISGVRVPKGWVQGEIFCISCASKDIMDKIEKLRTSVCITSDTLAEIYTQASMTQEGCLNGVERGMPKLIKALEVLGIHGVTSHKTRGPLGLAFNVSCSTMDSANKLRSIRKILESDSASSIQCRI